ncbi:MAG: fibronectin type III domain-containing protein [Clostridia bacterium]|nr:fibronectin type III domain-containing protein [Clostridia bacterium]
MKTIKKTMCIVLCLIMAFSSLPLFSAAAANESVSGSYGYSQKYYANKPGSYGIGQLLDEVDAALADANIYEEIAITERIKFIIDLRSVNALCKTLDTFADLLDNLLIQAAITVALGDLKELNFDTWKTGMVRSTANDSTILKEIVEFVNANSTIIAGIVDGTLNLGVLKDKVDLKSLLGEDGLSGIVKEAFFGVVYEGASLDTAYKQYKDDVDAFVYGPLLEDVAGEYLEGFTMTADTTVEDLVIALCNSALSQYAVPMLKSINVDFSTSSVEALRSLAPYMNLNGSTYDLSGLVLDTDKGLMEQLNDLMGLLARQIFPGCTWDGGDFSHINDNLESILKHLGKESGLIPDAYDMSFEEIAMEVVAIVLDNLQLDSYADGIEECDTLEELLKSVLVTAARESGITYTYTEKDSWEVVLGDIFAVWMYDLFDIRDADGKPFRGGNGDDIWTALNYAANYFLIDKKMGSFMGLSTAEGESIFTKVDKILDYFGETKSKGIDFSLEEFLYGSDSSKGLIESVFTLDIENIFAMTVKAALDGAGDVKTEKFLYNTVRYFINNLFEENVLPAYIQGKAFTNALSNNNIATLISGVLSALSKRRSYLATVVGFICNITLNEAEAGGTFSAEAEDALYTGALVHPDAKVILGGEELTMGEDFVVIGKSTDMGPAVAEVRLTGIYNGNVTVPFNITPAPVSGVTVTTNTTKVRLRWSAAPGADRYNVYMGDVLVETIAADAELTRLFTELEPMTRYSFKVEAVNDVYGAAPAAEVTALTNPVAVTGVKVKSVTESTVTLTWDEIPGATGYDVEIYSSSKKKYVSKGKTSKTSYKITGRDSYTAYKFRVRAYFTDSEGTVYADPSAVVSARTKMGKVANLEAASKTSTSVKLSWDKVKNAKGYTVERYSSGKWVKLTNVTGTSYTVKSLKASTSYKFRVRAYYNTSNYGDYSDTLTVYTNLPKVTGLKAASATASSVKLSWSKVSGATNYVVYRSTDGKKWTKVKTVSGTSLTVSGLSSGTTYQFKVCAYRSKIKTYGDYSSVVKAATLVGKVDSLEVTSRAKTSIKLSWAKEKGAAGYVVYRSTDGKKWTKVTTTSKTAATVSGLTKNTTYQFKVRAYQKVSGKTVYGSYSSVVKGKTKLF